MRPESPSVVYLDSCILLSEIQGEGDPVITEIFRLVRKKELVAVISGLHYVEVLGKRREQAFDSRREALVLDFIENQGLRMTDIGPEVQFLARELALHSGVKPLDAMHVAAASIAECDVLMTSDQALTRKFKGSRLIKGVWVDAAYMPGPLTLPFPASESAEDQLEIDTQAGERIGGG